MRILIAEDEMQIAKALKVMLEHNRYQVDIVHNGEDALYYILNGSYDTIVLDIMMPKLDGLSVLKTIREKGITTPVLFLTAKSETEDRVAGLNAGADDYLPKPFASAEFLARVNALLRRSGLYCPDILSFSNIHLNRNTYELSSENSTIRLNNKEFQLLEFFMRNPRHIFSTIQLMEHIWGLESNSEINVVWTYIANLRKKLKDLCAKCEIRTARGAGFSMEETKCCAN